MAQLDKDKPDTEKREALDLTLLSNFIHQIVNPLNGVAGTLDNLVEGRIEGAARQVQRQRVARMQIEQCIALVRNLAYFAQGFEALDMTTERIVVVPQVIIEAAMYYQEEGSNNHIAINLTDRQSQNKAAGRPELIRQVLMNLFDNAVKYSAERSTVEVHQRIQRKTGNVLIEVVSSPAVPIRFGDLENIFELGFRGDNARKTIASGTGLGLHICKRIVEDVHGGTIRAEILNGGSQLQFTISLPPVQK